MTGRWWCKVVAMVMVMMIDQGCCRSVMNDDGSQDPARGAYRGGADLVLTSMCGGGDCGGEDLERVSAGHYPPASASLRDGDGDDDGDGSVEGSKHQHCGGGEG
jgi:hypothetical protein